MSGQAAAESVGDASGVGAVMSRSLRLPRSSTWAKDVSVEITRIEHRLRIALVSRRSTEDREIGEAIRAHLKEAEEAISRRRPIAAVFSPIDWYRGTSLEQAYRSLHDARVFLVELVPEEDLDALVPGVLADWTRSCPASSPSAGLPARHRSSTHRAGETTHRRPEDEAGQARSCPGTRIRRLR
jgi:hypothetical protein